MRQPVGASPSPHCVRQRPANGRPSAKHQNLVLELARRISAVACSQRTAPLRSLREALKISLPFLTFLLFRFSGRSSGSPLFEHASEIKSIDIRLREHDRCSEDDLAAADLNRPQASGVKRGRGGGYLVLGHERSREDGEVAEVA